MGEVRLERAVELSDLTHNLKKIARIEAAAPPANGVQAKTLRLDRGTMAIYAGCDVHFETGFPCRACHR